jgi:TonB family protein
MELNSRVYLSKREGGPVFAIVSLSGIKSNPALYTEMQRINSYVDAFKNLFPPKLSAKVAPVKLTLVGEKTLEGHLGREYTMSVGTLAGTVQTFATKRRFYALVYLNSKKDEPTQDEFVSSFSLPQKTFDEPAPTVAAQNPPNGQTPIRPNPAAAGGDTPTTPTTEGDAANGETKPTEAAQTSDASAKRRPISGGVLNGKAISLPKPDYPVDAKTAGAAGSVAVQVTVDEAGTVVEAKAISGHPLLQQPSVNAALQARFAPTSLMGEPVRVTGVLVFNFVRQ